MRYKLAFYAICGLFLACNSPQKPTPKTDVGNAPTVVEQPRHVDSLWVNDGFAWRKYEGYLKLNLSENLTLYAQNPIPLDSSPAPIYHIKNFEIQLNNKLIFSYPKDAQYINNQPLIMEINTSEPKFPKIIKQSKKRLIVWKVFNPNDTEKKYVLQAVTVEQDSMKAFFNPVTNNPSQPETIDRETWRLIFNEAFSSY